MLELGEAQQHALLKFGGGMLQVRDGVHRLTARFASVMVVLTGIVLAGIRYLPHG